jgi:hypothetical protein
MLQNAPDIIHVSQPYSSMYFHHLVLTFVSHLISELRRCDSKSITLPAKHSPPAAAALKRVTLQTQC